MVPLSAKTREHLEVLFAPAARAEAEHLLVESCGETLPLVGAPTAKSLERIRFAALKFSGGNLSRLRDAVRLAGVDWRDLLVAAGFADDIHEHERWQPARKSHS